MADQPQEDKPEPVAPADPQEAPGRPVAQPAAEPAPEPAEQPAPVPEPRVVVGGTARPAPQAVVTGPEPEPEVDPHADPNIDADGRIRWARPSKSQRKRDATKVTEFGERLVELRPAELAKIPMDDEMRQEVERCRGLKKNARLRQLRLIAKMLRERDLTDLQGAVDGVDGKHRLAVQIEKAAEAWRARLIEHGDGALKELLTQQPGADRQQLRQLMRGACGPAESGRTTRARRELLRALRELPLLGE